MFEKKKCCIIKEKYLGILLKKKFYIKHGNGFISKRFTNYTTYLYSN